MNTVKNLFVGTLILCLSSFIFTSCGDDVTVEDWVGTYTGDEVTTQTNVATDESVSETETQTVLVTAGTSDNTINVSIDGETRIFTIDGDKLDLKPISDEIESFGWEFVSGDGTLDGSVFSLNYDVNVLDVDGETTDTVNFSADYTRQ